MRTTFYLFLLSILFLHQPAFGQMLVGSDTLVGNEWIEYGRQYHKFSVQEDGAYRVTGEVLQSSGINLGSFTGASLRLYSMGRQVPIYVSTDGPFSTTDFMEFYGHKNRSEMDRYLFLRPDSDMLNPEHSLYTDKTNYYLSIDGEGVAERVQTLVNEISNPPAASGYFLSQQQTLFTAAHFDPYIPVEGGGGISYSSYVHGEGFSKGSEFTSTINVSATDKSTTGPDAILHLRMVSANYGSHSFPVTWNDQPIGILHPSNLKIVDTSFVIPLSQLLDNNVLKLNSDVAISRMAIVDVTLTYPKVLSTTISNETQIQLLPNPEKQYYIFENFNHGTDAPLIYSTDGKQRMLADIHLQNQMQLVWPSTEKKTTLHILDPATGIRTIPSLEPKKFTDWSADNTAFIIITHPDLMASGTESEYVQYRSSAQGGSYHAKAYSILDIYDQFGYGIEKHPQSIRNFIEFAYRHWSSAKMIFLVGRAVEYDRSRYENGTWESSFYVPTFGKPGSDQLLAATLWNLVPRYPIARLAVTDVNTIQLYLDKVKEHDSAANEGEQTLEDKEWIKHVVHISGGMDAGEQDNFKDVMATLGQELALTDFGAKVFSFYKTSSDFIGQSQSKQIDELLHQGSSIINYLGHSSTGTFEFTINDPSQWDNKGHYPIFSAMGCSAGAIHGPLLSLSDRYVLIPDEGAIAFISGSGSQYANSLITWARPWYQHFGTLEYGTTLGESILHGLQEVGKLVTPEFTGLNAYRYLLEQQTTQGDPALLINPLPGPDYLVDRDSVSIVPSILNTRQDSFDLQFNIANIGRNLRQNVSCTISLKSSNGTMADLMHFSPLVDQNDVTINVRLPLLINKKPGVYRLLISLDDENLITELPAPAAESNNRLEDNLGVEGISLVIVDNLMIATYPPDFAIVNKSPVQLIATGSNAFSKGLNIVFEVDTTPFFNSPSLLHENFIDHSATISWSPQASWIPDQVYYWRVSTDSISPEQGFYWSRKSFIYQPGSLPGWNQSQFYQQTENHLEKMVTDSLSLAFDFESTVTNFRILNRFQNPIGGLPFGYIDNIFYTEFFSKFSNNDVHVFVVAINPVTGAFMRNPNPGLYGSFNNLSYTIRCFPYRTDLPESRQALINFIKDVIPPDYYVILYTYQREARPDYFPEQWAADEENYEHSIFSIVESEYPESAIRSLASTGSKPYITMFQKGNGGLEEIIATDTADAISLSYDIKSSIGQGTMISPLIGPASKWHSIHWDVSHQEQDTSGWDKISAWAMSADFADTLWISLDITEPQIDISTIDAKAYPWVQLKMETLDSSTYQPAKIDYWRVLFNGYPEFIIDAESDFQFIADTLQQGEKMSLRATIENVSDFDADSLPISLNILGGNSQTEELMTTLPFFGKHSTQQIYFERSTADLSGDYQVVMELNPNHSVPEHNFLNNIGLLSMVVLKDDVNPVLDVTFDGVHIQDGDVVAAKPLILIKLTDESQHLRLTDTSLFEIYLQFPSEFEFRQIPFTSEWLTFIEAPASGNNEAMVEMRPDLSEDGIYQLEVRAKDATGNLSGDNNYFISFRVTHDQTISRIYNYPNPFNHSTQFIYTLTGEGSPAFYVIQIVSMDGILVREITQDQIGPLAVGTHMTHYEWDGTDDNGNPLSSGVYLYKMFAKKENGEDYGHYETYDDNLFKNGWGKLVIIR